MSAGRTIQIYCPSGEPRGVRIAEITTRIVQAVVVPRAKLDEGLRRDELRGVGLYLLFGESEPSGRGLAYIGEAEDCGARFRDHNRSKDFWNVAVAIVSRTGSLTKAHCRLLEYLAIAKAREAGRYELDNGNAGSEPVLPEWMRADVIEVFETAETLLGSLGYPVFEPPAASNDRRDVRLFFCRRGGFEARGVYNEEGFVVLAGSKGRADFLESASAPVRSQRQKLIDDEVIISHGDHISFTRDTVFQSPSAAASAVCAGSANGWIEWKDDAGRTLDEVYRRE